jgi:hypothetical protein
MDVNHDENVASIGKLHTCMNMLINMHKGFKCNMETLVEKLSANVPMV